MIYYKIIKEKQLIGVVTSNAFMTVLEANHMLLSSNEIDGQFLEYKNQLYHDTWMAPLPNTHINFIPSTIMTISKEEYDGYFATLSHDEPIFIEEEEELPIVIPEEPDLNVEIAQQTKIEQLSRACKRIIESGFDLAGSHYSMTTQDQINMLNAQLELINGAQTVLYHADGEPYREFTASEMAFIIEEAAHHKNTQLARFNELKQQILAMDDINEILSIQFEG